MILRPDSHRPSPLILSGIHLNLTPAMKAALETKALRLFRLEPRIVRLRVDVVRELSGNIRTFTAKGKIEIAGPDLWVAVTHHDAYTAINQLINRLSRKLRKRTTASRRNRTSDDIRSHSMPLANA